ncbi:YjfB family protein [Pectinatus cerevisiiphilus]|uniref:Putative motility protein YjfB-like n=1 Tax=Pectinatus cerevisiiphilus TaxID=86956 RepID=A0A4R3KAA6_9FIRM|nr:YjfB family protein [Pectinatus cerevisiiphilus]TCS80026.1 putative motility protein YjfB-like [Pectinatus cerevisiiphilus]
MDTSMSIAAMSVGISQERTQESVGVSVLGKVFDDMNSSAEMITEMSVGSDPNLGTNVDLSV